MEIGPDLEAARARAGVERTVSTEVKICIYRLPQIISSGGIFRLVGLLGLVAGMSQISIQKARRYLIPDNGLNCRASNKDFAAFVMSRPEYRSGAYFRLEYWWHGLGLIVQTALYPRELWSIERWHVNDRYGDAASVVDKLAAQ